MAKLLSLNKFQFLPSFRDLLKGSPGLGALISRAEWIDEGSIAVWVPDEVTDVRPENLAFDLFNEPDIARFGMKQVEPEAFHLFDRHLRAGADPLVVTDTFCALAHPRRPRGRCLSWFSLDSPRGDAETPICAYLTAGQASTACYEELLVASSSWPMVIMLTSLPRGLTIRTGDHIDADAAAALVDNVEHVLLAVFDEISFMLWSRAPPTEAASGSDLPGSS